MENRLEQNKLIHQVTTIIFSAKEIFPQQLRFVIGHKHRIKGNTEQIDDDIMEAS